MTTIPSSMSGAAVPAATTTQVPNPNEPVGSGSSLARVAGGTLGFGAGVGVAAGITKLVGSTPVMPIRNIAFGASLAALGGGAYLGQKLLGNATRQTRAEVARENQAQQADLRIQARVLQAEADGSLDGAARARIDELRGERREIAEGPRDRNAVSKALPYVGAALASATVATLAYKLSHDDGKGINQMFNGMMGAGFGAGGGLLVGRVAGQLVGVGPAKAELPAGDHARIAGIDAELDQILGEA